MKNILLFTFLCFIGCSFNSVVDEENIEEKEIVKETVTYPNWLYKGYYGNWYKGVDITDEDVVIYVCGEKERIFNLNEVEHIDSGDGERFMIAQTEVLVTEDGEKAYTYKLLFIKTKDRENKKAIYGKYIIEERRNGSFFIRQNDLLDYVQGSKNSRS